MKKSNTRAANPKTKIQCVEILVSKNSVFKSSHNLRWMLSVYSLENEPVKKNLSLKDSEVFHFMVYDWNRTIKQLLDEHQVPYSIVQFFTPESLFPETPEKYGLADDENSFLLALHKLEGFSDLKMQIASDPDLGLSEHRQEEDQPHFILDERDF